MKNARITNQSKQGFTLVELSIVLVIIGLLIGGILAAQSMIETTKINKTITEFQAYNSAAMLFQSNYNCLPGDCTANRGLTSGYAINACYGVTSSVCNVGDGNGIVGNYANPATYYQSDSDNVITGVESANFWTHMNQIGYIKFTHKGAHPTSPAYGMAGWSTPAPPIIKKSTAAFGTDITGGGGWYIFGVDGTNNRQLTQTFTCKNAFGLSQGNYAPSTSGVITNSQALALDTKLDDGMPLTGSVTATASVLRSNGTAGTGASFIPTSPSYATYAANCLSGSNYNTSYSGYDRNCGILICSDF